MNQLRSGWTGWGLAITAPGSWKTRRLKVKARLEDGKQRGLRQGGSHARGDPGCGHGDETSASSLSELRRLWGMCSGKARWS